MLDEVIMHEAQFRNQLVDLQKQIDELEELGNRFTDAMDEIFASPAMGDYILRSSMEFDDMEREIKRNEEGRKEGLRRIHEKQQEQVLEQEEESQLLNN